MTLAKILKACCREFEWPARHPGEVFLLARESRRARARLALRRNAVGAAATVQLRSLIDC